MHTHYLHIKILQTRSSNHLRDKDCKILIIFPDQTYECYILWLLLESTPNWLCFSSLLRMTALGFDACKRFMSPHDKISRQMKKQKKNTTSNDFFQHVHINTSLYLVRLLNVKAIIAIAEEWLRRSNFFMIYLLCFTILLFLTNFQ